MRTAAPIVHARPRSDINVTPLVDIVLVLLIIFIVMVPTLSKVLPAALPVRGGDGAKPVDVPLVITLDAARNLHVQQQPLATEQLPQHLVEPLLLQPMQHRKVFLKVDENLPHSAVVTVMDHIRKASLKTQEASKVRLGHEGCETRVVVSTLKPAAK